MSYYSLISLMPKAVPLLLDQYPNAVVAYSLRKLRSAYSGSAIRVRRGVDSTELDIGFNLSGNLDTDAIINFFGNNLLLQSENFANASWSKGSPVGSVVSTGVILAPNGIDMADKLDENTTNGTHLITQASGALTIGEDYFLSIYLRAAERNVVEFVSGIDGTSRVARVNLITGAIVSNTFTTTPTLTNVGNDWWKFEIVVTSAVTSVPTGLQVRLTDGATQSYIGTVGSGCYVWGAQVSGYTGVSVPYFKTTTIRAADASIHTFYDQSGNGRNAVQSLPANQATIVSNGSFITIGSKITTNWNTDSYTIPSFSTTKPLVSTFVFKRNGTGNAGQCSSFSNNSSTTAAVFRWFGTNNNVTTYLTTARTHSPNNVNTGYFLLTTYKTAADFVNVRNNSAELNGGTSTGNATINSFGNANGSSTTGNVNEAILWYQDYISLIPEIETKINEYYGIY